MQKHAFKGLMLCLGMGLITTLSNPQFVAHAKSIPASPPSLTTPKFNKSELSKFLSKNKNMLSLTMSVLIRGSVNGVEWVMNPTNSGVIVINKKRYQPMSWT